MPLQDGGGKAVSRAKWSGRRRAATRTSGYHTHDETTGGEFRVESVPAYSLSANQKLVVSFEIPDHSKGEFIGFGGWYKATPGITCTITGGPEAVTLTDYAHPNWNKFGSKWRSDGTHFKKIVVEFTASQSGHVSLYSLQCGVTAHEHLTTCRAVLLEGLDEYAPEVLFITKAGNIKVMQGNAAANVAANATEKLHVKSCNRCGRYLPINFPDERNHLSFTNHCTREDILPCKHGSFGSLRSADGTGLKLRNGFQLECRFCKRYTVNGQHNPQRTQAQMKEDASRRRAFELLLAELYGESKHLQYRHKYGRELDEVIRDRFNNKCFKCGEEFGKGKPMHLDHTRPLALLWPIDDSATALCGTHNTQKRDRSPAEFYSTEELRKLSKITGVPFQELATPGPNIEAIDLLLTRRKWFFDEFLKRPELNEVRDGKLTAELLLKAIDKALARYPGGAPVKMLQLYHSRNR